MTLPPDRIRVLTWNVHGCIGSAGHFDPDAIIAALQTLKPDIAAVQEIDSRARVAGELDTFGYLRRALGWRSVESRTMRGHGGEYGHALMSPWTLEAERTVDLAVPGFEPRTAISCEVRELGVRVIASHLGLRARERRKQIGAIVAEIERHPGAPQIVLGDFNEWRRIGVASRLLCPRFLEAAALPSYPAWRPLFALDRIWCEPPLEPVNAEVGVHMAHLSDHLPVIADLRRT